MHQTCEYATPEDVERLFDAAENAYVAAKIAHDQNIIFKNALFIIAKSFPGKHCSAIARAALNEAGTIAKDDSNVVRMRKNPHDQG